MDPFLFLLLLSVVINLELQWFVFGKLTGCVDRLSSVTKLLPSSESIRH